MAEPRGPEGSADALISRDDVLGGLPARRARTLLFLIESRTAHLVAKSRQAMQKVLTAEATRERDLAFLEAFTLGREPPLRPTVQDLERQAVQWAPLVPDSPRLRAALAHLLGEKYRLVKARVPRLRAALGLDDAAVSQAHQQLYQKPLETIYTPSTGPRDRLRWAWAAVGGWLDALPPFWTAFALTLTETVGAGILALPIALAGVGPLPGVGLLVILGALNVLTVAALAEAAARSASVRYHNAFFGRLVGEFLGGPAALIASAAVTAVCVTALLAYYLGLGGTLADATGVPPGVWMAALFGIQLYFLTRASLDSTVASALVTGAVNMALIVVLALLAFVHAHATNLLYVDVPFVGGRAFDPGLLRLVFGVVLIAYCGHLSVGNCAQVVLRRDPSGRSLLWGCAAAQACAVLLYAVWVLAVAGAVAAPVLAGRSGTAIAPLASAVGTVVRVLGAVYAVLAMGMASVHFSLGLFNLVRDRLPRPAWQILVLPQGRVRLAFREPHQAGREARLTLRYLGRAGAAARFHAEVPAAGGTRGLDVEVAGRWDATLALAAQPGVRAKDIPVAIQVLEADDERVRLRVESPLATSIDGDWTAPGAGMADVLELPDEERRVVTWLARHGEAGPTDVAAALGTDEAAARRLLERLLERDLVHRGDAPGPPRFRARLTGRRTRTLPAAIWDKLGPAADEQPAPRSRWTTAAGAVAGRLRELLLGRRGRFLLGLSPTVALFLLAEWLVIAGADSFSEALNMGGVIGASLIAGILPVLLLASTARKGEIVPQARARGLARTWARMSVYSVFLAGLGVHALLIWEGRVERATALITMLVVIGATVAMVRGGAFTRRAAVELRQDAGRAIVNVVDNGRPWAVAPSLRYEAAAPASGLAAGEGAAAEGLATVSLSLPDTDARQLKVWTHRMVPGGDSELWPATVTIQGAGGTEQVDLALSGGQAVLPIGRGPTRVEIALTRGESRG